MNDPGTSELQLVRIRTLVQTSRERLESYLEELRRADRSSVAPMGEFTRELQSLCLYLRQAGFAPDAARVAKGLRTIVNKAFELSIPHMEEWKDEGTRAALDEIFGAVWLPPDETARTELIESRWDVLIGTVMGVRDLLVQLAADLRQQDKPPAGLGPDYEGYVPADTLAHDHGIRPNKLSAESAAGKVRTKPAPNGYLDTQGRHVRKLYCLEDALKHCSLKHIKEATRRKMGLGN